MNAEWNLDISSSRDVDKRVNWSSELMEQKLPPIILYAYFSHESTVPGLWKPHWLRPDIYQAFRHILRTGNKVPKLPFETTYESLRHEVDDNVGSSLNSLARWRSEKEFRACLCLHQIHLWRNSEVTQFSMSGFYQVGWTPPAVNSPDERPGFPNLRGRYTQGSGIIAPSRIKPKFESWGVRINVDVGFRIEEWLPKVGSYLLWGKGVPYMRMILDLEVRTDGGHVATINGSYLPTQIYQIDDFCHKYDMINNVRGYEFVKNALGVGGKRMSPERDKPFKRQIP